jgi:hypothetical protein
MNIIGMLTMLSLASLGGAGGFVWAASRSPSERFERWGGALLVAGLGLLGAALQQAASAN